jgi:hypothetical protein
MWKVCVTIQEAREIAWVTDMISTPSIPIGLCNARSTCTHHATLLPAYHEGFRPSRKTVQTPNLASSPKRAYHGKIIKLAANASSSSSPANLEARFENDDDLVITGKLEHVLPLIWMMKPHTSWQ